LIGLPEICRTDRAAPPRAVAIHFGENRPGNADFVVEGAGQVSGFLTGHGIHHQQHFIRVDGSFDVGQFGHHLRVNLQASGGINNHGIDPVSPGLFDPLAGNIYRIGLGAQLKHRHIDLLAPG
jgi:hypothetical protein